ncbi:hypothetical protein ACFWAR_19785 [Streptomyces sp. NPDC059917]|uniref:hypothetical protein n=1 Tax=Streptomyces sp. NPDC059917 TaxID=3347002 RepID=UPI0036467314
MAALVGQQVLDAEVAFRAFGFQESDDSVVPVLFPNGFEWGVFLQEHVRRFDLFSAGHTHTAALTARIWDSEPDGDDELWDEQAEVDYESTTGDVAVWGTGRSDELIRLGHAGLWRVRVSCAGRAETERVTRAEGTAHGVERYLIDFWPKAM